MTPLNQGNEIFVGAVVVGVIVFGILITALAGPKVVSIKRTAYNAGEFETLQTEMREELERRGAINIQLKFEGVESKQYGEYTSIKITATGLIK